MVHRTMLVVPQQFVDVVKQYQVSLCEVISSKFGCMVIFEGVDTERSTSLVLYSPSPAPQDTRWQGKLDSGVTVSVCKADLTHFRVDAVVNAANENLRHSGGLAAALSSAGGSLIQKESNSYIKIHGPLKTGDAIICGAGSLPCKLLIHAVGPRVMNSSDLRKEKPLLEKTIRSILDRVGELNLRTVAIPAISSGIFNYPLQRCADTIVQTVNRYYGASSTQLPAEIFFVNHDEPTVVAMERACQQFLSGRTVQHHSAAAAAATSRTRRGEAATSLYSVELGSVLLTLTKGAIEEQKTDVIVNTVSKSRDLHLGVVSQAISEKAGLGLQRELSTAAQQGNIIVTDPYRLHCKKVFHTFCIERIQPKAAEKLRDSVKECLWMAVRQHKSIAFPAIGTGKLGFDQREVASIMSDEVLKFADVCPKKIQVVFVIFPSDEETFEAFEEEIQSLQQKVSGYNFNSTNLGPSAHTRPEELYTSADGAAPLSLPWTLKVCLSSSSEESTHEAEKWLSYLMNNPGHAILQNSFIQHLSHQDQQLLSSLTPLISVEEFFTRGHACMKVESSSRAEVMRAVLRVEDLLHRAQTEFVTERLGEMKAWTKKSVESQRTPVDKSSSEFSDRFREFRNHGLKILKMEKVKNEALKSLFESKQNQLKCNKSRRVFQGIPAQFCDTVSRIGFQAELAPPEVPSYGEGIYFTSSVNKAKHVWVHKDDQYLYFVEAQLLTGKPTAGKQGLILPPKGDSVVGGADGEEVWVVFSGYQALPTYIITCEPSQH